MSTGKNTPFNLTLIGTLLGLVLFAEPASGAWLMSDFSSKLTCHFMHANLFHWYCNSMALWLMRPSPKEIAYAFPVAVISMFFTMDPTAGFSAVIYAHIGMNIIRWNISLLEWVIFIFTNTATIFIPGIAFGVHLAAFMLGISIHIIKKQLKRIQLSLERG